MALGLDVTEEQKGRAKDQHAPLLLMQPKQLAQTPAAKPSSPGQALAPRTASQNKSPTLSLLLVLYLVTVTREGKELIGLPSFLNMTSFLSFPQLYTQCGTLKSQFFLY